MNKPHVHAASPQTLERLPEAPARAAPAPRAAEPAPNFLRTVIAEDNRSGKYGGRVVTRFPPEPNGYLHYGHAKSIVLNFGLAEENAGTCHLRYDDTNPLKEEVEFEDAIAESVRWLGFDWGTHRYHASDYYDELYRFAEWFVEQGLAYVDSQSAEEMRATRGTLTEPGIDSPHRNRSAAESLDLLRRMRAGEFADGAHVLRLKIDMASPNVNMRDPAIYRIRHASHHRTGDKWCIYPLYDYTHCISDALERITHSICTLEFQDHRPLYDWVIEKLADGGLLERPLPHQYEFARLNLTYVVLSKRKLIQLVTEGHVDGWDDPRMPTLVGARRRGFTPAGFRAFAERIGVSKSDSWIEMSVLEDAMREDLNAHAMRRMAVLDPIRLVIDNYPEGGSEECLAPNHPQKPELGRRTLPFTRELWIEREDFAEAPPKGYFRLSPGAEVRLRYAYVVRCTSCEKDADVNITVVHCT
jgi:glutaminyl-tRNA synthetase